MVSAREVHWDQPEPRPEGDREPKDAGKVIEAQQEAHRLRSGIGYVLGALGIVLIGVVGIGAFCRLSEMTNPSTEIELRFEMVRMAAHAVVAVALVYFGYQLVRLGERLNLPPSLINSGQVDMVRAILGTRTPASEVSKQLEALSKVAGGIKK